MQSSKASYMMWFIFMIVIINNVQAIQSIQSTKSLNITINSICSTSLQYSNRNLENIMMEPYLNVNITNDTQNILENFNKILWDLKKLKEKLNTCNYLDTIQQLQLIRKTRAVPRSNRSECSISKDELLAINNEIQNTLELKETLLTKNNCEFNLSSTQCAELIKIMECGITNLKNQFIKITLNSVPSNEITKWKNLYEKMNELNSRIENDLLKKFDQKYKSQINELLTNLHILKESIDKLEKKLEDANKNIKQSTIKFCASEIHSKRIQKCGNELNNLNKKIPNINFTEVVIKIIEISYEYIIKVEDMPTIDYIINFISILPSDLAISAANILYEEMRQKKHLNTKYVLTFNSKIQHKSSDLSSRLKIATRDVLVSFGYIIRTNSNYNIKNDILLYARQQEDYFYNYLKELISNAYSKNVHNAEKIIFFLDSLVSVKQKVLGYYSVYNEIKNHDNFKGHEIIMLVSRIKKIQESSEFFQLQETEKYFILSMIIQRPLGVKALLWDKYIFVISIFNNYKLVHLRKYFGVIYISTILAICPSSVNTGDKWVITEQETGRYYKIKNLEWADDIEYYWKISVRWNGNNFVLTNKFNDVPLYTNGAIGGWIAFWYSIPSNCYQVYYDKYNPSYQAWKIY